MLLLKRVYEPPGRSDGRRVLTDRLWPRGLSKEKAAINEWMKELAPSTGLCQWFGHDPKKWLVFRRRYRHELRARGDLGRQIARLASRRRVTLVFGACDETHNDAVVLGAVLRLRMKNSRTRRRPTSARSRNAG